MARSGEGRKAFEDCLRYKLNYIKSSDHIISIHITSVNSTLSLLALPNITHANGRNKKSGTQWALRSSSPTSGHGQKAAWNNSIVWRTCNIALTGVGQLQALRTGLIHVHSARMLSNWHSGTLSSGRTCRPKVQEIWGSRSYKAQGQKIVHYIDASPALSNGRHHRCHYTSFKWANCGGQQNKPIVSLDGKQHHPTPSRRAKHA